MSITFVESVAKTDKLHCTDCNRKIKKGEAVVFELDDCERKPMKSVFGPCCKDNYQDEVVDSTRHPHDLED